VDAYERNQSNNRDHIPSVHSWFVSERAASVECTLPRCVNINMARTCGWSQWQRLQQHQSNQRKYHIRTWPLTRFTTTTITSVHGSFPGQSRLLLLLVPFEDNWHRFDGPNALPVTQRTVQKHCEETPTTKIGLILHWSIATFLREEPLLPVFWARDQGLESRDSSALEFTLHRSQSRELSAKVLVLVSRSQCQGLDLGLETS